MRPRKRRERAASAAPLRCSECGSQKINCERAAVLVAEAVELREGILILAGSPVPQRFDDVHLICMDCGAELDSVEWSEERPQHVPDGRLPLSDAGALDALAAELNEPGDWNGADVCELAADLLRCTGRPIEDEPDDEEIWH
jgi:hypothetical protein